MNVRDDRRTEYREITIVLNPVLGPRVAIKAVHAAPRAVKTTIAAMADWKDKK